ncbi:hypothetical protein [Holdemanella biformis]|uniref:hypothetical protein n=1 Tax=Holdemanella biformis TaxID=1735 RepID=UPI00265DCE33|nr:hypothetical protein [Holdemanella biformis]
MEYIGIGICVIAMVTICIFIIQRKKNNHEENLGADVKTCAEERATTVSNDAPVELVIKMELLPAEVIKDESALVEITDRKVLAHIYNLVPELAQAGNATNNVAQAIQANGEVLYRAILPAGAKLSNSRTLEGAVKEMYHGANGIKGHADWLPVEAQKGSSVVVNTAAAAMGVASMVVGQYYMTQINAELGAINDGISEIQNFQDNEYRSRVFSLIAHVKKIADFQTEILENNELRISKINQLDSLEEECTQLLGQANLTLASFAKKTDLDYETYEKVVGNSQNWFMYQKSLLDVLYKIAELRYTLHLGAVSREQCIAILPTYTKQVQDTQSRLAAWHEGTTERLKIDTDEVRRKRAGFDGVIHFLPGLFNEDLNYRSIEKNTVNMIRTQISGESTLSIDKSELYSEDVQLIAKDGKIYYLP